MHHMEVSTTRWDTGPNVMSNTEFGNALFASSLLSYYHFPGHWVYLCLGRLLKPYDWFWWLVYLYLLILRKPFVCQTRILTHKDKITWKASWDKAVAFVHIRTFQRPTSQLHGVDDKYTLQHQELCIVCGIHRERGSIRVRTHHTSACCFWMTANM